MKTKNTLLGDYLLFLKKLGNNSFYKIYQCKTLSSEPTVIAMGTVDKLLSQNSFQLKEKELIGHYRGNYDTLLIYDTY